MTGIDDKLPKKHVADDLEPYRRLIEVQKQLVQMARQYEQTRRECKVLREQVAREVFSSLRWRDKVRYQFQRRASRILRRLPRVQPRDFLLRLLSNNQPSSC